MTKSKRYDYIIAFAVFTQPILILLQHLLINVFYMPAEQTTTYRVVLTAIPMITAILLSVRRAPLLFAGTYGIAAIVFLLNLLIFPENEMYLRSQGLRFFLPVVLPSALCLVTIKDRNVIESVMLITSSVVALEVVIYAVAFYAGVFYFTNYNMSFSYACLLPMLMLYSRKNALPVVVSAFLFLVVLAIGSRGAAFFYVIYVVVDLLTNKGGNKITVGLLAVAFIISWSALGDYFSSIGVSSRTMELVNTDLQHTSGRENVLSFFFEKLIESPILGIGMFGDRTMTDGAYCHNFIMEILLDFGILVGSILIISFLMMLIHVYNESHLINKKRIWMYLIAFIAPLMFSDSYLLSNNAFIFVGLLFLINKENAELELHFREVKAQQRK